jgi:hypothetical protein
MLNFALNMRYLVTFRKRFDRTGEPNDDPHTLIDVADGVVEDCEVVETIEPYSLHASEDINSGNESESAEDDGFLAFGTETWVYDIADGREDEFKAAAVNSEVVLEIQDFDDELIRKPFAES